MDLHQPPPSRASHHEILSTSLGVSFTIANALCEADAGIFERHSDEERWQHTEAMWRDWIEGRESLYDIRGRFVPFIDSLRVAYGHTETNLLLIGHGTLYNAMLPAILTDLDHSFVRAHPVPGAAYIIAQTTEARLRCVNWRGKEMSS